MHDLSRQLASGIRRADSAVLAQFPLGGVSEETLTPMDSGTGALEGASFVPPHGELESGETELLPQTVQQYFSGGNSVGEQGAKTIERAYAKDQRTVAVNEDFVVQGLVEAGYVVNNGLVSRSLDGAPSDELFWQVPLDVLLNRSGSEFFKGTAKPLIDRTISESPLPAALRNFTAEELKTYLVQLWPTIRTTPRGLILACTQPQEPDAPRGDALALLRKQIVGILQDELGIRQQSRSEIDAGDLTLGSDAIKLNGSKLLVLRPRSAGEQVGSGGLDTLSIRAVPRASKHMPHQVSGVRPDSERSVSIGSIMEEDKDGLLFTHQAHLRDYERSLNTIFGDTTSRWKEVEVAPEVQEHCLRFCQWLSGDIIKMPDGTRASEKMAYWLVAASVESRFPEKVILIKDRLSQVFPDTFRGAVAKKFWELHAMDAGEQGHGESLIRTLGAVFPPAGVDPSPETQLKIALERLVAVDSTARYFREIVAFDEFMVQYITEAGQGQR